MYLLHIDRGDVRYPIMSWRAQRIIYYLVSVLIILIVSRIPTVYNAFDTMYQENCS